MVTKKGNVIVATWEKDRINGEGEMTVKGRNPKQVLFKDDIIIEKKG